MHDIVNLFKLFHTVDCKCKIINLLFCLTKASKVDKSKFQTSINHLEFNSNTHLICLNAKVFLNRNKELRKIINFSLSPDTSLSSALNGLNTCFRDPDNPLFHRSHIRKSTRHYRCRRIVFKSLCSRTVTMHRKIRSFRCKRKKRSSVIFTSHPSSGRLKKGALDVTLVNSRNSLRIEIYMKILNILFYSYYL